MKKILTCFFFLVFILYVMPLNCFAATQFQINYDKDQDIFWYNTTVTKATTSTKYRVIGYTVRYNSYSTTVKLDSFGDIDNGNGTLTVPIVIPAHNGTDSVMNRFFSTNPGHDNEFIKLWSTDSTLYFDAIMTIVEGSTPLATMNSNGTFTNSQGGTAVLGKDYFTSATSIQNARSWRVPSDINSFYNLRCEMKGIPTPPGKLTKPTARISKGGSIVTGTISYLDNEEISLAGDKSAFPSYANHKYYKWEYKASASSTWTTLANGEGKISPSFPKLAKGTYDVRLTVWYGIGDITYTDMNDTTQIALSISESPQGAYVTVEPSTDGDIFVTQAQIDSNATIKFKIHSKGTLKNYTDTSKISQWKANFRYDPSGSGDQLKTYTYSSSLGLVQLSDNEFTAQAGELKNVDSVKKVIAVSDSVTVNGKIIYSTTEKCAVTLYKKAPPVEPPQNSNLPPVAVISAPSTVKVGDDVFISGLSSYDPDGIITQYLWNVGGADERIPNNDTYGTVTFSTVGEYTILLVVVDNGGASAFTRETITVVPPTPSAGFSVTGKLKEKRIVYLNNTSTSPTRFPIDTQKTTWSIIPVPGSGASNTIRKVVTVSSIKENVMVDPYTTGSLNKITSPVVSFEKSGQYDVTLSVTNTAGYTDTATQRITIQPDLPAVVSFKSDTKIYRETIVSNTNYAKISVIDSSYSPDGDYLSYRKVYAVYDANNNGVFGDAGDQNIVLSETSDRPTIDSVKTFEYMTKEVGKYEVHILVKESYVP